MKNCPVCRGEGKLGDDVGIAAVSARKPFISQLAELIPSDLMSYGFGIVIVAALAWLLHAWIVLPAKPVPVTDSPELQCAKACGDKPRFKAYTYPANAWTEPDGSKWGKSHPPTPAKCECIDTPPEAKL